MLQKMLSCFTHICNETLLLILGYSFGIWCNFADAVAVKSIKIMRSEAALLWHQICWWNWRQVRPGAFPTEQVLVENIMLDWKGLQGTNALAYSASSSVTKKSFLTFANRGGWWGRNRSKVRGRLQGRGRGRGLRQCLLRGPARTQRGQQDGAGMDTQREIAAREWVFIFLSPNSESGNRTL